jgi:hypothetical protein
MMPYATVFERQPDTSMACHAANQPAHRHSIVDDNVTGIEFSADIGDTRDTRPCAPQQILHLGGKFIERGHGRSVVGIA